MKKALALGFATAVTIASAVLMHPPAASAHYTDSLHRHEWTYVAASQLAECIDSSWDPYGQGSLSIAMYWPNLITSPVRIVNGVAYAQNVYLLGELQFYNFGTKSWMRAGGDSYSPWYQTLAGNKGMVGWWFEKDTNRYAPNRLSFDVVAGYVYRIKVWYQWGYDGTWHSDVTNYCDFR